MRNPLRLKTESANRLSVSFLRSSAKSRTRKATDPVTFFRSYVRRRCHALLRASSLPILLIIIGCTGEAPVIEQVRHTTIAVHNVEDDSRREMLSVFAHVTHPDSFEDLDVLQLQHENAELEWERHRDNWALREWSDRSFVGASGFQAPGGEALPRGTYQLTFRDIGGRSAETRFEVRTLDFSLDRAEFPSVEITTGEHDGAGDGNDAADDDGAGDGNDAALPAFRVSPEYDDLVVVARNADGETVGRYYGDAHTFSIDDFDIADDEQYAIEDLTLFVQSHVERSQVWMISGPWRVGEL